jgi:vacuolar protein sorting-associated protein 54
MAASAAERIHPAISTVLNHPHKKQAPPKAHSHLPAAPPADLPRVKRRDFEPYLRALAPEWDRFATRAAPERAPAPPTAPPPLDGVPRVFFAPAFALADAAQLDGDSDALERHTAAVEHHLVAEIHARAPAFFAALANLHALRAESAQCLDRVRALRAQLAAVDEQAARPGLRAVRAAAKLRNVCALQGALGGVRGAVAMTGEARARVNAGDWAGALAVTAQMRSMWEGPLPLAELKAFAALPTHLAALDAEIAGALAGELGAVLRADLAAPPDAEALRTRLRPLVDGLVRTRAVKDALATWRESVLAEIHAAFQRVGSTL